MAAAVRIAQADLAGLDALDTEALALLFFLRYGQPRDVAGYADWRLSGRVARLFRQRVFTGAVGEALLMPSRGRLGAKRIFLLGLGPEDADDRALGERMRAHARVLADAGAKMVAVATPPDPAGQKDRLPSCWLEAASSEARFERILVLVMDRSQHDLRSLESVARRGGLRWDG